MRKGAHWQLKRGLVNPAAAAGVTRDDRQVPGRENYLCIHQVKK